MLQGFFRPGEFQFIAKHDDRKGHHYYTRWLHRPTQACIVVMTLAVIMGGGILQKNETHPEYDLTKFLPPGKHLSQKTLTFSCLLDTIIPVVQKVICLVHEGAIFMASSVLQSEASVVERLRKQHLIESVEQMSPVYLEGITRILTVSADTELIS